MNAWCTPLAEQRAWLLDCFRTLEEIENIVIKDGRAPLKQSAGGAQGQAGDTGFEPRTILRLRRAAGRAAVCAAGKGEDVRESEKTHARAGADERP